MTNAADAELEDLIKKYGKREGIGIIIDDFHITYMQLQMKEENPNKVLEDTVKMLRRFYDLPDDKRVRDW